LASIRHPSGQAFDEFRHRRGSGTYTDAEGRQQAYYVNEVHGTWGKVTWPEMGELNQVRDSSITNLECPSAGNCPLCGSCTDAQGASAIRST
jgi:hypothetical protein